MTIRVANAAAFLGDSLDAPRRLIESAEVDFLTLEYLAELTMSILARQREKDARLGYAGDFLALLPSLTAALKAGPRLRIVTNAGGVNPHACARQAAEILDTAGLSDCRLAAVTGDDLLAQLPRLRAEGCDLAHLETGESIDAFASEVVSAHAYLGAGPIVEALDQDARMTITGRVTDASLTLGPALHHFGWSWDDWDRLAAGTVAGHLIECGAQVTGGYSSRWDEFELSAIGYPIAELSANGETTITKPAGSGGRVDRTTVVEQLVYEIGDPGAYLTPDVVADFSAVQVTEEAADRVRVTGARGYRAPDSYKVAVAYRDGFYGSGQLLVAGPDCRSKAARCAELVFDRLARGGITFERSHVELLGTGAGVAGRPPSAAAPPEVVLRIAVHDADRARVERFSREMTPLITNGPAGLAGYVEAARSVRPVFAYWPALVPKDLVEPCVTVRTARQWLAAG